MSVHAPVLQLTRRYRARFCAFCGDSLVLVHEIGRFPAFSSRSLSLNKQVSCGLVIANHTEGLPMNDYAEPHFNDEQTVLRARRVVPLKKIEARVRHRRQWFLGTAFALAMILGAASALVASYLKLRNAPQAAIEVADEPDVAPAPVAVATPIPEESATPAVTAKKEPAPKRRIVATQPTLEPIDDPDARQASEAEQLQQVRDAVLYDEWQERRARRVERQRRRADRYNHRDLSNLDEIFEGRRRRRP